jgi:hypothetical protein
VTALRRNLYRAARILGDVEAVGRGPGPYARRVVRRRAYRVNGRWMRRLLRKAGL